jgi:hypothetical protein
MQFKHPEILYALLLLIIPILVHLFKLQRFKKVPFTNVQFLKNIVQQTRKSSRVKKLLILLTRMATFACLIIAFSQPYLSNNSLQQNYHTTIYLDNSFSMQAKGENGELLKSIAQQIIENTNSKNTTFSLITNNNEFKNIDSKTLKNELITCDYSPNKLDLNTVLLKLNSTNLKSTNTLNKNIIISDFQTINFKNKPEVTNVNTAINVLKVHPKKNINIFIDSIYIAEEKANEITLSIVVKSTEKNSLTIPISLQDNTKLLGKSIVKFNNSNTSIIDFSIPNIANMNGIITLTDANLTFDNTFYFTLSKPEKMNVLAIGENAPFLNKIYTVDEFNFTSNQLQNLNYDALKNQHLIILNELENIPNELTKTLFDFSKNGGTIVIIPSVNSVLNSYNNFLKIFNAGTILNKTAEEHKITSIVFEHPLMTQVFENNVTNFQYPTTNLYYKFQLKNATSVLKLDSNEAFLTAIKNNNNAVYLFSSPLKKEVSNFMQSPLIVPVFYNFAKNSLKNTRLYYTIQPENTVEIITNIAKDNVLKVLNNDNEFIPLQEITPNKVILKIDGTDLKSGFYNLTSNDKIIKTIAFNYNREESELNYLNLASLFKNSENIVINTAIDNFFTEMYNEQKINWLFKWFLAFSVLFLLIEMLLLKYFKI